MFKKIFSCLIFVLALPFSAQSADENALFSSLLASYVHNGMVTYPQLCKDSRLPQYIAQLEATDPDIFPSEESKLAFWINAYNAYTLKLICDNYPLKSISELHAGGLIIGSVLGKTAWDRKIVKVNGRVLSLGEVEHKILRPVFKDSRIHFAIVCAAKGCPSLRSEAYEADRLDEQLNDQGRVFLSDSKKNSFDLENKRARISPVFSWFKGDFGGNPEKVLEYLSKFLDPARAGRIRADAPSWKIDYTFYDWSLNEQ